MCFYSARVHYEEQESRRQFGYPPMKPRELEGKGAAQTQDRGLRYASLTIVAPPG